MRIQQFTCGNVNVEYLVLGMLENNVYLVSRADAQEKSVGEGAARADEEPDDASGSGETSGAAGCGVLVVDPSCNADAIMAALAGRPVDAIMLTHFHADHMGAAAELRRRTGAPVVASRGDAPFVEDPASSGENILKAPEACPVDVRVQEGQEFEAAGISWRVMETPGHSEGSMCWFAAAEQTGAHEALLLSGDTLFCGSMGRTDFKNGNMAHMRESLSRLAALPPATLVLPGHGQFTTIAEEHGRVLSRYR